MTSNELLQNIKTVFEEYQNSNTDTIDSIFMELLQTVANDKECTTKLLKKIAYYINTSLFETGDKNLFKLLQTVQVFASVSNLNCHVKNIFYKNKNLSDTLVIELEDGEYEISFKKVG